MAKEPVAVIDTSMGKMVVRFRPDKAPKTVKNFIQLACENFYDNLSFHRIIAGFMIQGGCPKGDGTGGPGFNIKAEFNDIKHEPGVLSMARSSQPDSAGSQFFICTGSHSHLDGNYTAFGKLIEGMDVLAKIGKVKTGANDRPVTPVKINKITVEEREFKS
jgi:peptidyl-prolyl cis-trans isomerase B (cyclophilin B)